MNGGMKWILGRIVPALRAMALCSIAPRKADGRRSGGALAALAFLLLGLTGSMAFSAESPAAAFEQANRLYEQGKFAEAAAAYEQLIHSGHRSAALFYNLGNAWFKAGQQGRAIAAYRQAEKWNPRDPNLNFNLQF